MSDPKYLPAFSAWLHAMGEDVLSLANQLEAADAPVPVRQASAAALLCLRRSTELIPDGLEPLGYLELAFAFRVIAERALADSPDPVAGEALDSEVSDGPLPPAAAPGRMARLAADAALVGEFLGEDLPHFRERVLAAGSGERAGHSAAELLDDLELQAPLLHDVRQWAEQYRAPELGDGEEELVKIGSFFRTRLRRAS